MHVLPLYDDDGKSPNNDSNESLGRPLGKVRIAQRLIAHQDKFAGIHFAVGNLISRHTRRNRLPKTFQNTAQVKGQGCLHPSLSSASIATEKHVAGMASHILFTLRILMSSGYS